MEFVDARHPNPLETVLNPGVGHINPPVEWFGS
jgi:hypothetical protein